MRAEIRIGALSINARRRVHIVNGADPTANVVWEGAINGKSFKLDECFDVLRLVIDGVEHEHRDRAAREQYDPAMMIFDLLEELVVLNDVLGDRDIDVMNASMGDASP